MRQGVSNFTSVAVAAVLAIAGANGLEAAMSYFGGSSGQGVIISDVPQYSSGSDLSIQATITLSGTEINGVASGATFISNPYDFPIYCDVPSIDITTPSAPVTFADIYLGSGSRVQTGNSGSTTTTLANNFRFDTVRLSTLSGATAVTDRERFKLYPYGNTTMNTGINIVSRSQSGANLVAKLHVPCHGLQ